MNVFIQLLLLACLVSVTCGIKSPLSFVAEPSGAVERSIDLDYLLQVRGGADVDDTSYVGESETVVDLDVEEVESTTDVSTEEISVDSIEDVPTTEVNTNIFVALVSSISNMKSFYMNLLNSHPVPTVIITTALISLIIWGVISSIKETGEEKEEEIIIDEPISPVKKVSELQKSSVRGLLTGVGTAAATSYAIYQVVTRPQPSINDDEILDEHEIVAGDNSVAEESSTSMFKGV